MITDGFWDADEDDDAAFERRLDVVVREIGDRGKPRVSEAVPPEPTPAPAPAPAPIRAPAPVAAPAPAPAPALAPAPNLVTPAPEATASSTLQRSFTPSLQLASLPVQQQMQVSSEQQPMAAGAGASLMEVAAFIRGERDESRKEREEWQARLEKQALETEWARLETEKHREEMHAKMEQQRAEAEAQLETQREKMQAEAEARLETQRIETETVRAAAEAKICVSEAQLEALQVRLDALHQAKLLTDDEVVKLEDCVGDFIECWSLLSAVPAEMGAVAGEVKRLVGLSEGVSKDGALARQLRRKFA